MGRLRSHFLISIFIPMTLLVLGSCAHLFEAKTPVWSKRQLASISYSDESILEMEELLKVMDRQHGEKALSSNLYRKMKQANQRVFDGAAEVEIARGLLEEIRLESDQSKSEVDDHRENPIMRKRALVAKQQLKRGKMMIEEGKGELRSIAWLPLEASREELKIYVHELDQLLSLFKYDVEPNKRWREELAKIHQEIDWGRPLSSSNITAILKHIEQYEKLVTFTLPYANSFRSLVDGRYKLILTLDNPTSIESEGRPANSLLAKVGLARRWKVLINPNDLRGQMIIGHIKLGLAAALLLYDDFALATISFQMNTKLRLLVNYDHQRIALGLKRVSRDYFKLKNFRQLSRAAKVIQTLYRLKVNEKLVNESQFELLDQVIENSGTFLHLEAKGQREVKLTKYRQQIQFRVQNLVDFFRNRISNTTQFFSRLFGNAIGAVTFRQGKILKNLGFKQRQILAARLKPLDILLEKTPFRMTDYFIPGHFGHLAIWTGSKEDLIEHNLWDHPLIKPHQHGIEFEGKRLIEALRDGVVLSTLDHFIDIDDLAVLRSKPLSLKRRQHYLLNAFRQLGKEYDFNFDVETNNRIVCSELAYVTFDDLDWPYERHVGRFSISPDNVLEIVFKPDGPFSPLLLYHDGKEILKNLPINLLYLKQQKYHLVD
jgi:hypothetical protein